MSFNASLLQFADSHRKGNSHDPTKTFEFHPGRRWNFLSFSLLFQQNCNGGNDIIKLVLCFAKQVLSRMSSYGRTHWFCGNGRMDHKKQNAAEKAFHFVSRIIIAAIS